MIQRKLFEVWALAWSPDGTRLAVAGRSKTVRVLDATTLKTRLSYRDHQHPILRVAWSPDSQRIASAGQDNSVQVWDAKNGLRRFTSRSRSPVAGGLAWSPDGQRLAAGVGTTIRIWDIT